MLRTVHSVLVFYILVATLSFCDTTIPGGNISGTWMLSGSPYLIQGDVIIPLSSTLTIEPGVQVIFQGNYSLTVNGYIQANGTVEDSIYFTKEMPGPGWEGIRFVDAPGASHLYYCVIQYGNASGSLPNNLGGGIYIRSSNPIISHCRIANNTASFGGGIYAIASDPVIEYCLIYDNTASNYGGAIHLFGSDAYIRNCTIAHNQGTGAGGLYIDFCSPAIVNTIVAGNTGYGGIYFVDASNTEIAYSDFHNNEYGAFTGYVPSGLGTIVSTNANGDPCDGYYNIFLDPQFVNPVIGDLRLQSTSACIDAGDPNLPWDPDSTIADIGVYHFDQLGVLHDNSTPLFSLLNLASRPNPFTSTTEISFALPDPQHVVLTIYDNAGRRIATLVEATLPAGQHEYYLSADGLANGLYYCNLRAGGISVTERAILLR